MPKTWPGPTRSTEKRIGVLNGVSIVAATPSRRIFTLSNVAYPFNILTNGDRL